jgi:hypothetical protein
MKNKKITVLIVISIVTTVVYNVTLGLNTGNTTNFSLANVEALASGEDENCPGDHCSHNNNLFSCEVCCPSGKIAICNSFGCKCE